jgi:hypothetical protein
MGLFGEGNDNKENLEGKPLGAKEKIAQITENFNEKDAKVREFLRKRLGFPGRVLNEYREGAGKGIQGTGQIVKGMFQGLIPFNQFKGLKSMSEGFSKLGRSVTQGVMAPVRGVV